MKIALIGSKGQLGSDLVAAASAQRFPNSVVLTPLDHTQIEITNPASIADVLGQIAPDRVINTAAYNLVDQAEDDPGAAYLVNTIGPRHLAKYCAEHNVPLAHVSTDYVFTGVVGQQQAWIETDIPVPAGTYGLSKLAGEDAVRAFCPQHFVVRTCGLYGHFATRAKGNFVETMLRLGAERPELKVVCDQTCTPTSTADLAPAILNLCQTDAFGTYHITNSGRMSWYEFAQEIFAIAGLSPKVIPVPSSEYTTKARRPKFSVLDCDKAANVLGQPLPDWRDALRDYLKTRSEGERPA